MSWDDVRHRFDEELAALADEEFLVVGEPPGSLGPARGLLRRRTPPPATAYVQARRDGDHVYAECVGATSFGGDLEIDPTTQEELRRLGWLVPGEEDASGVQPSYPSYWMVLPGAAVVGLARTCAASLEALGVDPACLEWRRSS